MDTEWQTEIEDKVTKEPVVKPHSLVSAVFCLHAFSYAVYM